MVKTYPTPITLAGIPTTKAGSCHCKSTPLNEGTEHSTIYNIRNSAEKIPIDRSICLPSSFQRVVFMVAGDYVAFLVRFTYVYASQRSRNWFTSFTYLVSRILRVAIYALAIYVEDHLRSFTATYAPQGVEAGTKKASFCSPFVCCVV